MKRENEMISSLKSLHENRLALALEESKKLEAKAAERDSFRSNYYAIREMKERLDKAHATLLEAARDDALATVVKAIYITALEAATLTDNGILLAESMVDDWIRESGGASKILSKVGNDTYLLSRITQIVEDAAQDAVNEVEADDKVEDDTTSSAPELDTNASKEVQIAQLTAKDAELKAQIATLRAEKKAEEENSANDMDMNDSSDASSSDVAAAADDATASEEEKPADDTEASDSDTTASDSDTSASDDTTASDSDTSADTKADEADTTAEPAEDTNSDASTEEPAADASADEGESTDTQAASPEEPETDNSDADTSDMSANDSEEEKPAEDTPETDADANSSDMDTEVDIDSTPDGADDSADEDNDPLADDIEDDEEDKEADGSTADGELTTNAEVDPEEDPDEDDDVNDALGDPIETDDTDTDITVDGDTENNGKIFDQLDKEEDVQKAIDLIRTRVADAEETFIRNNAEDKKKIDELLDKISNNVKTVEDLNNKDNPKSKVAEESVRMAKRDIEAIREKANLTIFEKMARNVGLGVVKNSTIKESYMTEEGTLDVDLVVETTKVMYGFLETINTLQLEKVNCKYIENVINNMK